MLVGRIDSPHTTELVDGAAISSMVVLLSGEAVGVGLATALDTLCSQAHGTGRPKSIGVFFQTGLLVLATAYVPIFCLNWLTEDLLNAVDQPAAVARLAGQFSRLLLPGLPFMYLYELLKKVLQAQNVVAPLVVVAVLSNCVNLALGMYLTWHTPLGFRGAALARSVSQLLLPLGLSLYFVARREAFSSWWPGWQPRAAFDSARTFLALGVPGMAMVVLEYLSYDIVAVLVAYLPHSVLAVSAHSVLWNVANIAFRFYMGIAVATNVLVGNYVGAGLKRHAKTASHLGLAVVLALAVAVSVAILAGRTALAELFVSDAEAVARASVAMLYLVPFELFDSVNCVMQGVFRGTGRQTFAAVVNLVGLFVIGFPCRYLFAFPLGLGVEGFWLGLVVGYVCCVAVSLFQIWRTDWDDMVAQAKLRTDV